MTQCARAPRVPASAARAARLAHIARRGLEAAAAMPNPGFHLWIVRGLPALYLSDPKVKRQGLNALARELLATCGTEARLLHWLFRAQRHPWSRALLPRL